MKTPRLDTHRLLFRLGCLLAFCITIGASWLSAREVTITITGSGKNAKYTGDNKVTIDDTVIWKNDSDTPHTATCELLDENQRPFFNTKSIRDGEKSAPQKMTRELFEAAQKANGKGQVGYYCIPHRATMQAELKLSETAFQAPHPGAAPLRQRRDITTLSPSELTAYRDAWRRIQRDGSFADLAGYHDCPNEYCHRQDLGDSISTFLPWHREYCLRMEALLNQPLHYWDWTSNLSLSRGIPAAFLEAKYISADGNEYDNPLRSFSFICQGSSQTTVRYPRNLSFLPGYRNTVRNAYRSRSFNAFNIAIDTPHGNMDVWVGGDCRTPPCGQMSRTTYAAYDPIFWAHHSNVDRQWASRQISNDLPPASAELTMRLRGFGNKTIADVLTTNMLGYAYDRYDVMPTVMRPLKIFEEASEVWQVTAKPVGQSKTFQISDPQHGMVPTAKDPLHLFVGGISDHPPTSYFVYIFVNNPKATPADASPDNPNFVGTFAVFGGSQAEGHQPQAHDTPPKRVLQLFGDELPKNPGAIKTITLVITDEKGNVIPQDKYPFGPIVLKPESEILEPVTVSAPLLGVASEFEGISETESYDEAFRNAMNQAQAALSGGHPDLILNSQVISVSGTRGGVAGFRRIKVKISAWLSGGVEESPQSSGKQTSVKQKSAQQTPADPKPSKSKENTREQESVAPEVQP